MYFCVKESERSCISVLRKVSILPLSTNFSNEFWNFWIFSISYPFFFPFPRQDYYRVWLWIARRVSYKKQEQLVLIEHLGSLLLISRSVSCAQCCQCLWILHSLLPLQFSLFIVYSQTILMWPSTGTVKYGHIRQVVA